jgi:hypothetical protein
VPYCAFAVSTSVTFAATASETARFARGFPQPADLSSLPPGSTTFVIAIGSA